MQRVSEAVKPVTLLRCYLEDSVTCLIANVQSAVRSRVQVTHATSVVRVGQFNFLSGHAVFAHVKNVNTVANGSAVDTNTCIANGQTTFPFFPLFANQPCATAHAL